MANSFFRYEIEFMHWDQLELDYVLINIRVYDIQ